MASYVVMEPPVGGVEDAVFVRDEFRFLAFLAPLLWLLFNRLWLETLAVMAVIVLVVAAGSHFDHVNLAVFAIFMLALLVGLEASTLKIAALRRRGWRECGIVDASDIQDAQIRYFADYSAHDEVGKSSMGDAHIAAKRLPARRPPSSGTSGPVLGMLDFPGRS